MDSVITRVKLLDKGNEQYSVLKSHVKQTKKLLREVLQSEKKDVKGIHVLFIMVFSFFSSGLRQCSFNTTLFKYMNNIKFYLR